MYTPYTDPAYNPYPPSVLLGTSILFIITSIAAVGLRFYSRSLIKTPLSWDDWITIPSMLICIGLSVNQIIAVKFGGLGGHQDLVNGQIAHTPQLYAYEKTKYAYQLLGTIGLFVVKLSVLFFYRRIFSVRAFNIVNTVFIYLTLAWGLAFTFAGAFQCTPVSTLWDKFEIEYGDSCVNVQPFYLGFGVSDLILDVLIFALPMPHLYSLQMPMRQKLAIGGIFFLGSIVVAIGITRIVIFQQVISFTKQEPFTYFYDITWYTAGTLLWHLAENAVALVGCCLPTYRPLLKSALASVKTTVGGGSRSAGLSRPVKASHGSSQSRPYYQQHNEDWPMTNWQQQSESHAEPSVQDLESTGAMPDRGIMVHRDIQTRTERSTAY
ncbi:hypothetical protein KVR01_000722 [Diaporthe batatas]|uniref:uncharacterized protein n=1 Tax=Diaporthe batatas TaxID=748121 RepID=UPI001D03ABE3|nr:uncharacterized protein KVR01_000722 [Diaporthe batatas]KAG8169977.1 hypothetical protein KVR01_000722 [Diaporthe batatas]